MLDYFVRVPSGPNAVQDHIEIEKLFIECKMDNFMIQMFDVKRDTIEEYYLKRREWEITKGQRFGVYDKQSGKLCGAFRLVRASEEYNESNYIQSDDGYSRDLAMISYLSVQAKLQYPEYFKDMSNVAIPYSLGVKQSYRGKGLTSMIT